MTIQYVPLQGNDANVQRRIREAINQCALIVNTYFPDGTFSISFASQILGGDGSAALPSYSFTSDPDTGIWHSGANAIDFATGGVNRMELNNTSFTLGTGVQFRGDDGAVGAPGISFQNDTDTGIYRDTTNSVAFSAGGTNQLVIRSDAVIVTGAGGANGSLYLQDKSAGNPALTFLNDQDTGLYRSGGNELGISTGGVAAVKFTDSSSLGIPFLMGAMAAAPNNQAALYIGASTSALTGVNGDLVLVPRTSTGGSLYVYTGVAGLSTKKFAIDSTGVALFSDGVVGSPALSFISDTDTGFYRISANAFEAVAGATRSMQWNTTAVIPLLATLTNVDGTAAAPTYSFNNDTDTGIYRVGANTIGFSVAGVERLEIQPGFIVARGTGTQYLAVADGTAALPDITFNGDNDTGIYRVGANEIGITSGGTLAVDITSARMAIMDGAVGTPALTFTSDPDTGVYHAGSGDLRYVADGTEVFRTLAAASGAAQVNDGSGTFRTVGYRQIPRSTTATTLAIGDVGKCVAITAAINIPASVFSAGDAITIYNDSAGTLNLTISAGTLRLAGTATTGTRTIAIRGFATIWFNSGGATPEVIASGNVT